MGRLVMTPCLGVIMSKRGSVQNELNFVGNKRKYKLHRSSSSIVMFSKAEIIFCVPQMPLGMQLRAQKLRGRRGRIAGASAM